MYTTEKPANQLSRGITLAKLVKLFRFRSLGPQWVTENEEDWPLVRL